MSNYLLVVQASSFLINPRFSKTVSQNTFGTLPVNDWELRTWTLKSKVWTSQIWTLIHLTNNFVIVLLCAKSLKLITLEENIISIQQLPLCFSLFFVFSSEVLNSGIKSCFDGVVFQDAVCKECFIYVFGVFTFSVFCYCFYEGFIPKIILVSWFFLFICISYLLKVFRFDTEILCDSCAVLLLKTLNRLPQSVAFYVWFCFTDCFCYYDLLNVNRSVVESCYPPWIQLCFPLALSKLTFFELPVLIPSVFCSIHLVSPERSLNCISRIRCSFFWLWVNHFLFILSARDAYLPLITNISSFIFNSSKSSSSN